MMKLIHSLGGGKTPLLNFDFILTNPCFSDVARDYNHAVVFAPDGVAHLMRKNWMRSVFMELAGGLESIAAMVPEGAEDLTRILRNWATLEDHGWLAKVNGHEIIWDSQTTTRVVDGLVELGQYHPDALIRFRWRRE